MNKQRFEKNQSTSKESNTSNGLKSHKTSQFYQISIKRKKLMKYKQFKKKLFS